MMTTFDATDWSTRLDDLLSELPDDTLAARLRCEVANHMRHTLAETYGMPVTKANHILSTVYPDPVWTVPDRLPAGLASGLLRETYKILETYDRWQRIAGFGGVVGNENG